MYERKLAINCRKRQDEEQKLPNNFLVKKSRRMKLAESVACVGGRRNGCRTLIGNSERNRPFGRP